MIKGENGPSTVIPGDRRSRVAAGSRTTPPVALRAPPSPKTGRDARDPSDVPPRFRGGWRGAPGGGGDDPYRPVIPAEHEDHEWWIDFVMEDHEWWIDFVMKIMTCPLNGPRNISEFVWGGDVKAMPDPAGCGDAAWAEYLFLEDKSPARSWNGGCTRRAITGSSRGATRSPTRSWRPCRRTPGSPAGARARRRKARRAPRVTRRERGCADLPPDDPSPARRRLGSPDRPREADRLHLRRQSGTRATPAT